MESQKVTQNYMLAIIALGMVCLTFAFWTFPLENLTPQFIFLSLLTIALGSQISIQIPRFKSHIAVSDTFIFLALFLFSGEAAIILAAVEAFCSSWRFCNKKISVFFNAAAMAISLTVVVNALRLFRPRGQTWVDAPTGIELEAWQLPELQAVLVTIGTDAADSPATAPDPYRDDKAGIAIPVVPELC